jgi:hypothetical protein
VPAPRAAAARGRPAGRRHPHQGAAALTALPPIGARRPLGADAELAVSAQIRLQPFPSP